MRRTHHRLRGDGGQATVEAVALLPLLVAVAAAVLCVLAAGAAAEAAGAGAQAGAVALLQGGQPEDAVRRALPGWQRRAITVRVRGGRVTVTVRPRLPVGRLAAALAATASASAGAAPASATPAPAAVRGGDGASGGDPEPAAARAPGRPTAPAERPAAGPRGDAR